MNYFSFQPDLTASMPILKETNLILSEGVDPNMVQDVLIQELLPGAFSMLGTKVRLILVTVMISYDIAYWDLIFECPNDNKYLDLCNSIHQNSILLDDSFDHQVIYGNNCYKLSFKVG